MGHPHRPYALALLAATLAAVALGLVLLAKIVDQERRSGPPPGWTGPTAPPPDRIRPEMTP